MEQNFEIMDVTCRDGSYVIKFQLSTADEKHICQGIESLGYRYTEIGHEPYQEVECASYG